MTRTKMRLALTVNRYDLVLALFPNARGFAYVGFEGPLSPIDWGVSDAYGRNRATTALRSIRRIFQSLPPDVLVLRGFDDAVLKDNRRLQTLMKSIEELASESGSSGKARTVEWASSTLPR